MPSFEHGRNTAVFLDGLNLSPYLTATDFSIDLDTADTTTYGSTWKSSIAGTIGAKVDFGGYYDPAQTAFESLAGVDPAAVLTYCPGDNTAIGDKARMLSVQETSWMQSSPVGGVVAVKLSVLGSGVVDSPPETPRPLSRLVTRLTDLAIAKILEGVAGAFAPLANIDFETCASGAEAGFAEIGRAHV